MNKSITFLKCLLLAVILLLGSGDAWAATETISTFTTISGKIGTNVSYASFKGGGTSEPAVNTSQIRLYQNSAGTGGGFITVSVPEGYKISTASIQSGMATTVAYSLDGSGNTKLGSTALATTGTYTVLSLSANSVTFHCMGTTDKARLYVKNLSVTYEAVSSCTTPTYSFATPTSVSKLTTDIAFTNAFTSNNTSTKVWSSTNEAVATVDATTGLVTIHSAGTTSIKVNQAADATYCAVVDASYALTVTAPGVAEPTNQPTSFTATTNSTSQITVNWTDATGTQLPEHYLVKASTGTITAPVDGTAEAAGTLVKIVAQGTQTAVFTGLNASTTYNFSIWPYTNSGAAIDYKTDGTVATASATTETPLGIPVATAATDISATGFTANWGAAAAATGYDVSVYTKTGGGLSSTSFGFEGSTSLPTDWTGTGYSTNSNGATTAHSGTYYAGLNAVDKNIRTYLCNNPSSVSFYYRYSSATANSTVKVQTSPDGSNWSDIATYTATGSGASLEYIPINLNLNLTGSYYIQWIMTARTGGSFYFDDVTITTGIAESKTPISGSPFTVTETSKAVSSLNPGTEYFYTVVAKNASGSSASSNVISVSTSSNIPVSSGSTNASDLPDCPTCDVTVATGGTLTLNASKTYNSVTVAPGAKLTLQNGFSLSAPITLQSNASATATFVDARTNANKTNITATVQQHLPGASTRTWWYLASPVTGAASSVFGSNKVGDYSETTRSYSNPFAVPTTLTAGKGYVVKMTAKSAANYIFENKTLNTGNISVPLTRTVTETSDNAKRGFNLVGNPYPSYLNWDMAYNASTNLRPTIWYRTLNGTSMEFHTYNATLNASVPSSANGYIPPMQAFWVKVDKDPTVGSVSNVTLNFTNDMRSHAGETANPLKTPATDRNLVRLSISNGTLSDETVIVTHPSASDNYDSYDSEKMANGDTNRPEIFSMAGNQELVINGISPLTDSKQIALGVRPGRAGNYTISLTEWRNTGNMEAVLRDNQLGEELILTESNNYSFDTDGSTSTSRFSLLFRAKGSNTGFDRISSDLLIYASQKSIRVESASLEGNTISIFNALGQPVFSGKAQSNRLEINGLTPAVYMVKVNNQTKMVIVK